MEKKLKVDKDIFMDTAMPLLKDMENRTYDMSNRRDTGFLTLNGFLIATSGLIITSSNTPLCAKNYLIISIICFTIGWFLYFNLYGVQTSKLHKTIDEVLKFGELETEEDIQKTGNNIIEGLKIKSKDKRFNWIASGFWNAGLILFVVGLINFMCSFN